MITQEDIYHLIDVAAELSGLKPDDFLRKGRSRKHEVHWRNAIWLILRYRGMSFPRIADIFNCHYSTVIHGVKQMDRLSQDPRIQTIVTTLAKNANLTPQDTKE